MAMSLREVGSSGTSEEQHNRERKRMLRVPPPTREVPSLAIGHPHRDMALNRHVDHRVSFRTLAGRRRWRVQGWPRCSRRSEKAPAHQQQRAVRQRPAQRRNGRQHAVKSRVRKSSLVTVPNHPLPTAAYRGLPRPAAHRPTPTGTASHTNFYSLGARGIRDGPHPPVRGKAARLTQTQARNTRLC